MTYFLKKIYFPTRDTSNMISILCKKKDNSNFNPHSLCWSHINAFGRKPRINIRKYPILYIKTQYYCCFFPFYLCLPLFSFLFSFSNTFCGIYLANKHTHTNKQHNKLKRRKKVKGLIYESINYLGNV